MSPVERNGQLTWGGSAQGLAFSRVLDLSTRTCQRMELVIDRNEIALVLDGDEVSAVMLAGTHTILVLSSNEERGDLGRTELAKRLACDIEDLPRRMPRVRMLNRDQRLLYLSIDPMPALSFGGDQATPFEDPERGTLELDLEGVVRLSISDAVRFYESFLRGCEDLKPADFEQIVAALVQAGTAQALTERFDSVDEIEPDRERLAELGAHHLSVTLAGVGLRVDEIEITRFEKPLGTSAEKVTPTVASPTARR